MNDEEDYFRFYKIGDSHVLNDRIPFEWKELLICSFGSFFLFIFWIGFFVGLVVAILTVLGYTLYRFASWIYYSEIEIHERSGKMTRCQKILGKTQSTQEITKNFDFKNLYFEPLTRSGKTKFLMRYKTHKNYDLLILRNKSDKKYVEDYFSKIFS